MKTKKIFLPKWVAWFVFLLVAAVVAFTYYQTFYMHEEKISSFLFSLVIMVIVLIMIFYAVYRPLPYLLLQEVSK